MAVFKHHGAPGVHHQRRGGRAGLDDRAAWGQVAAQDGDARLFLEGRLKRLDDARVVVDRIGDVLGNRLAADGDDVSVQQMLDLFHHHRQATGVAEVLHQVLARRLQVQQAGHFAAQALEVVDRQLQPQPAGNGNQVDHRVGGAANGRQGADGVFEGFAGQHLTDGLIGVHHLHDAPPRLSGQHVAAAVNGREGGIARQADAQGLDHAGHGAGRSHGHAVTVAAVHAAFSLEKLLQLERAGAHLLAHAPDTGARAQFLSSPFAVEHGAARNANRGQANTRRTHEQRRRRLVAAHEQHHPIDGVAAYAFLHIHAGQVAVKHGGGAQQGLAQ